MDNSHAYIPLSSIVNEVLIERNDDSGKNVERFTAFAIRGFRELKKFTINSIVVKHIMMDDLLRIPIPGDMMQYTKIGINVGGRLWNLGVNHDLVKPRAVDCGNDIRDITTDSSQLINAGGYYYVDHWHNGRYVAGLYGKGGGFRQSYYTIDKERGMILFDTPVPRGEVILEYRSDGISDQTMVPVAAMEAIIEFINWRDYVGKKDPRAEMSAQNFYRAETALRSFNLKFDPTAYMDMLYKTKNQGLKR